MPFWNFSNTGYSHCSRSTSLATFLLSAPSVHLFVSKWERICMRTFLPVHMLLDHSSDTCSREQFSPQGKHTHKHTVFLVKPFFFHFFFGGWYYFCHLPSNVWLVVSSPQCIMQWAWQHMSFLTTWILTSGSKTSSSGSSRSAITGTFTV